jgi:succinate dehydrogenase/fumarate reductase flavoprotein subunit
MGNRKANHSRELETRLVKETKMPEAKEASNKLSRKQFVKGAAVGAVGAAAAGGLASCAPAATPVPTAPPEATATPAAAATATPTPEQWDYETDVVVVGSGNGGMSAAISAAKEGAKVIVVEISSTTGGGSSFSGGYIHAFGLATLDDYLNYTCGLHDPELGPFYFQQFQEYKKWLVDIGAYVSPGMGGVDLNMGQGEEPPLHCRKYFDSLVSIFEDAGGTILTKTRGMKILTDEEGTIVGLRAKGPEGFVNIKAKAVILSCGGFQNNQELRVKYFGRDADLAHAMAVPYNMGEGMKMAQEVGAGLRGSMSTFGTAIGPAFPFHNKLEYPEEYEQEPYTRDGKGAWAKYIQVIPAGYIIVNVYGKRYVDEASTGYRIEDATMRQPQAKGIVVFDETMKGTLAAIGYGSVEGIVEAGAVVAEADTISELADKVASLPYVLQTPLHKAAFVRTIEEYNQAVEAGKAQELDVPRTGQVAKIETPPFYAVPETPWVYMCFGGVAINKDAQVLDMQQETIPGLYATPPVAGGIQREIYTGSIGCAGTFGWIAGKNAAAL